MNSTTLRNELEKALPSLIELAKRSSWNKFSDNYKFIISEIKNNEYNLYKRLLLRKMENDKKSLMSFDDLISTLQKLYPDLYDINLYVYKAKKKLTIIEIQYYPKSALEEPFRQSVIENPPMLHCKVSIPPWQLINSKKKFDINWEHFERFNRWRLLRLDWKLRVQDFFHRARIKRNRK